MKPKSTAELIADRQQQRRAAQRPSVERPAGAPMFSSVGRAQGRGSSRSRLVLAIAAAGVGLGSLRLAAELFGWGRPEAPVRVYMMAEQAERAAASLGAAQPLAEAEAPSPLFSGQPSSAGPAGADPSMGSRP